MAPAPPAFSSGLPPSGFRWSSALLLALTTGLLLALAYGRALDAPFVLDDQATLVDNPSLRDLRNLSAVLQPPPSAFSAGRPLLNLSFALDYALAGGPQPRVFRLTNLVIHLTNVLLLAALLHRLLLPALAGAGGSLRPTWVIFAALLWGLHPVHTACVTYVSQRAESLMGLFYLGSLYAFVRGWDERPSRRWLLTSGAAAIAAVMVKEVAVTLPIAGLVLLRAFRAPSVSFLWREYRAGWVALSCCLVALAASAVATNLSGRLAVPGQPGFSPVYAFGQLRAWGEYASLALWPHPLIFDRGVTPSALAQFPLWRGAVALLLLGGSAVLLWRSLPRLASAPTLFLLLLAPTTSVIPIWGQPIAENRLYLALAPLCAIAGIGLGRWMGRPAPWLLGAVLGACGVLTFQRNGDFRSAERLWRVTVAQTPWNARARGSLGLCLLDVPGRRPEALTHLREALRLNPGDAESHYQLAAALEADPSTAAEVAAHYEASVALRPTHALAHARLGVLLFRAGRAEEGSRHIERAVALRPDRLDFRQALGAILSQIPPRAPEAVRLLEEVLREAPGLTEARLNLGNALRHLPQGLPRAIAEYETVLRTDPRSAAAWFNLAGAWVAAGRAAEAERCYEEVLRIAPQFTAARERLAQLKQQRGTQP